MTQYFIQSSARVIAICLASWTSIPLMAAEFHVSPSGSDRYFGTVAQPVASLHRAQQAARELEKSEPVTIVLGGGVHQLNQPLPQQRKDRQSLGER